MKPRTTAKTRRWGQHFLADSKVLKKIVRAIDPQAEDLIIEIGAGKGALTFPLAQKVRTVIAIEKDPELVPFLQRRKTPNLTIIEKDVLRVNFKELVAAAASQTDPVKIVGNLPYSISTPLMFKILEEKGLFQRCIFLVQKEVAERICARPGSKKYAPLSILVHNNFYARIRFLVHPGSFSPPPRVESALISLDRRASLLFEILDERLFLKFLQEAFRHRRKILLNNLRKSGLLPDIVQAAYEALSLPRTARPEELSLEQFVRLFNLLEASQIPC
jgi:16S rRNA (adenine1518-N6/adenine1519-N6)-dimethyltransferase